MSHFRNYTKKTERREKEIEKRKERIAMLRATKKKPKYPRTVLFLQNKDELVNPPCRLTGNDLFVTLKSYNTGFVVRPKSGIGFNWMLLFCMKRKRRQFPIEVLEHVNAFLNWIPAGCWNKKNKCCSVCGSMFVFDSMFMSYVCSYDCADREQDEMDYVTGYGREYNLSIHEIYDCYGNSYFWCSSFW